MALAALRDRHAARVVRVDSGGGLTGASLDRGLVDEISLLVHPCLAGPGNRPWHGGASGTGALGLVAAESLAGGIVWLRYRAGG